MFVPNEQNVEEHWFTVCGTANTTLSWEDVRYITEKIIPKRIILDLMLILFSLYPEKHNYTSSEQPFIDLYIILALRCIVLIWKKVLQPTNTQWIWQMFATTMNYMYIDG